MTKRALLFTAIALVALSGTAVAQGKGGGNTKSAPVMVNGVTVVTRTPPAGPLVRWDAIDKATFQVQRMKADDPNCCNNTSPAGLTSNSWEDAPLTVGGWYVYRVTATLRTGQTAIGAYQYQYVAQPSSTQPIAVTGIRVTARDATGLGPIVTWDQIANATFQIRRFKAEDINCCNNAGQVTGYSWEDLPLPSSGVYVYEIKATLPGGVVIMGATQFPYTAPSR